MKREGIELYSHRVLRCLLFYFIFVLMEKKREKTSNENERNVSPSHHSLAFVLHNQKILDKLSQTKQ